MEHVYLLMKKTLRVDIFEMSFHATMNEAHEVGVARKAQSPGKLDALEPRHIASRKDDIIAPLKAVELEIAGT
jgi:hypothetical protein